jgi:hypothetical protein
VAALLGGLGANLCYIGLIATIPLYFLTITAAYEYRLGAWQGMLGRAIAPPGFAPAPAPAGGSAPPAPPAGQQPRMA